jgi:hypothetical protein
MNDELPPFSQREVAVVLTGAEWFALLARLLRKPLSDKGRRVYVSAAEKLKGQLSKASGVKASGP